MYTIVLKDLMTGKNYPDSGVALYNEFCQHMNVADKIVVDLDGVEALPSMFLNTSIGALIDNYGKDFLKQKISFTRITRLQAERLQSYLARY